MKCFEDAKEASRVLEITLTKEMLKRESNTLCVAFRIIPLIAILRH